MKKISIILKSLTTLFEHYDKKLKLITEMIDINDERIATLEKLVDSLIKKHK